MYSEESTIPCIPIEASSLSELLLNFNDVYIFQAVTELSISALRNNIGGGGGSLWVEGEKENEFPH